MAEEWDSRKVQCHQCNKMMAASSLRRHLVEQHKVYQQVVVAEELLGARAGVTYHVHPELGDGLNVLSQGVRGSYAEGGCFGDTLGTYTPLIRWWSPRKGISRSVNTVQCRLTLRTPGTFKCRSARPGGVEVTKRIGSTFGTGFTPPVLSPRGCAGIH
jgi:hypothetical protein